MSENALNYEASWRCENFPDSCNFEKVSRETIERLEADTNEEIMEGPGNKLEDGKSGNYVAMPSLNVLETYVLL